MRSKTEHHGFTRGWMSPEAVCSWGMEVRLGAHCAYRLRYHVVWVCKYRRRILKPGVRDYLEKVLHGLLRKQRRRRRKDNQKVRRISRTEGFRSAPSGAVMKIRTPALAGGIYVVQVNATGAVFLFQCKLFPDIWNIFQKRHKENWNTDTSIPWCSHLTLSATWWKK